MATPEARARENIDATLTACLGVESHWWLGWILGKPRHLCVIVIDDEYLIGRD
jgi:hypothetical protein